MGNKNIDDVAAAISKKIGVSPKNKNKPDIVSGIYGSGEKKIDTPDIKVVEKSSDDDIAKKAASAFSDTYKAVIPEPLPSAATQQSPNNREEARIASASPGNTDEDDKPKKKSSGSFAQQMTAAIKRVKGVP